jgi:3-deoxy-7-phosphoheptulonate synthase
MQKEATREELATVKKRIQQLGYHPHVIRGETRQVIGAVGDERGKARLQDLESLPGVASVFPILEPYKLASQEVKSGKSVVTVARKVKVGGPKIVVMAGPCAVESKEQIIKSARVVKKGGATVLRGGAFKPRTSPYSFQGMEEKGLKLLAKAREETGLPIVTEVMNPRDLPVVKKYADIIQVGARNIQNFALLKLLGRTRKPIFLKRGMATTIDEFLFSAEYILSEGNDRVILCERGIRTFETATRNTLDLSAVPVLKRKTHLPVVVDPSHGTGNWRYVVPMCYAAVAAGADGIMVEVHPEPEKAESDGPQSLKPEKFYLMMEKLKEFARAADRDL